MPSIAQQDYNVIKLKTNIDSDINDAAALGRIKKAILQGIPYDTIIVDTNDKSTRIITCVLSNPNAVYYFEPGNFEIKSVVVPHTPIQYEGLAAIQDAADNYENVPAFETREHNGLYETTLLGSYVTNNGKLLVVTTKETVSGTIIDSIDSSNFDVPESETSVEISLEDAQKLIGLPCTE